MPGVIDASASHINKTVILSLNPETVSADDVVEILEGMGYRARVASMDTLVGSRHGVDLRLQSSCNTWGDRRRGLL